MQDGRNVSPDEVRPFRGTDPWLVEHHPWRVSDVHDRFHQRRLARTGRTVDHDGTPTVDAVEGLGSFVDEHLGDQSVGCEEVHDPPLASPVDHTGVDALFVDADPADLPPRRLDERAEQVGDAGRGRGCSEETTHGAVAGTLDEPPEQALCLLCSDHPPDGRSPSSGPGAARPP